MTAMYKMIEDKLNAGELVLLDGGTGTEMQRKGAPMSGEVWCALATRSHPEIVRDVHADYIRAGADIITANTYATSPLILRAHDMLDEMVELDGMAVRIALEARDAGGDRPVCVAGSMSVMPPVVRGTDRGRADFSMSEEDLRPLFQRKAEALAEAGAEMIMMEMMRDLDNSLWATEAAVATGLPVWMGIAVKHGEDGPLTGFNREEYPLADLIEPLMATGARVAMIMHSSVPDTDEALPMVFERWSGPVGAYPESGYFTIPDWVFGEITPEDFAAKCVEWRAQGASVLGGCCGITPEHIAAASAALGKPH